MLIRYLSVYLSIYLAGFALQKRCLCESAAPATRTHVAKSKQARVRANSALVPRLPGAMDVMNCILVYIYIYMIRTKPPDRILVSAGIPH